ncbi:hypothetical protein [Micromonospora taraxaci]|uniref:hypothetical protein n=1 Tax=Micromonospora taraxaci TaxID=1316803 RepID=UPI0033BD9794
MGMDVDLLLGKSGPEAPPLLEQFAPQVAAVLGVELVEKTGSWRHFFGRGEDFVVWLDVDPDTKEPFLSHPFVLEVSAPRGAEAKVGTRLFQKLADTGRFRVMLLLDHDCVRSTHFPCEDW